MKTEAAFLAAVENLADALNIKHWHDNDSRRNTPGWLDLVLCGSHHLCFAELKMPGNDLTSAQREWRYKLWGAGQKVFVWYPEQLWSGEIERVLRELNEPTVIQGRALA